MFFFAIDLHKKPQPIAFLGTLHGLATHVRVGHVWVTCGSRVGHVWVTCGSRVGHVWVTCGSRVGYTK